MSHAYHRQRPEGLAHRARIRAVIVPRLVPGCRLPATALLGRWLGISQQEACRHLRRVLAEDGIATETRRRRIYVTAMPEGRAAA